jgi:AcrR family transcriptional regulator
MLSDWDRFHRHILALEREGLVTRTFRRLDPERQQAVLAAILEEAADKGPAAVNIKQVALRAGVSIGSLYQYFRHRDGLLEFAVELCVRTMSDAFDEFRPYLLALPLREALSSYLMEGIAWGQSQAGLVRFFARAAYYGESDLTERVVRPIAARMRSLVGDILRQAAERGDLRPDVDLEAAVRLVNVLTIAVGDSQLLPYLNVYFQVSDGSLPPERLMPALLDLVLTGIEVEYA